MPEDTYLTPVPGVEEVSYTVRGVDEDKNVIYEETLQRHCRQNSGSCGSDD